MSSTTIKTLQFLYCLLWTCTQQSSLCLFFFNRVPRVVNSPQFSTQPITFKVPKKNVGDLKTLLENNPEYLKELVAQSRLPNSPISVVPKSLTNQPDTEIPMSSSVFNNVPILIPTSAALLPDEIMYNGQKWKKTTRGNMLMNNGFNYLKRGYSTLKDSLPQPSLHDISVTFPQEKKESEKWKNIEIIKKDNSGTKKVDEYTSSSESYEDDSSDGDNDDEKGGSKDSIVDVSGDDSKKINDKDDDSGDDDINDVFDDEDEDGEE